MMMPEMRKQQWSQRDAKQYPDKRNCTPEREYLAQIDMIAMNSMITMFIDVIVTRSLCAMAVPAIGSMIMTIACVMSVLRE